MVQNPQCVQADTHDYFLPRLGRLSPKSVPLSRSGPCGSVEWCSKGCTRTLTIYGVARGLVGSPGVPKSCTRTPTLAGWCSRCCADGVVFQKVVPESPRLDGMVFQKLGWCSKKLSQNPHSVYYYWQKYVHMVLINSL